MATPLYFNYATLTAVGHSWCSWEQVLRENGIATLTKSGGKLYGVWIPLFGLASNQVIVMTW